MKRSVLLFLLFFVAGSFIAGAQTAYYPTMVAWDAVTPELPSDTIEYEVYLWDSAGGDITSQPIESLSVLGTTTEAQIDVVLPHRSEWYMAVRTKATDALGTVAYSPLAYSTVPADCLDGQTFGFIMILVTVPQIHGLRVP